MDLRFFVDLLNLIHIRLEELQNQTSKTQTAKGLRFLKEAINLNFRVKDSIERAFEKKRIHIAKKEFPYLIKYIKT